MLILRRSHQLFSCLGFYKGWSYFRQWTMDWCGLDNNINNNNKITITITIITLHGQCLCIYGAVIVTNSLREFSRFIWWIQTAPSCFRLSYQANRLDTVTLSDLSSPSLYNHACTIHNHTSAGTQAMKQFNSLEASSVALANLSSQFSTVQFVSANHGNHRGTATQTQQPKWTISIAQNGKKTGSSLQVHRNIKLTANCKEYTTSS